MLIILGCNISGYAKSFLFPCFSSILQSFVYKSKSTYPSKWRSRSWSVIFAMTPLDGKRQNLQKTPLIFALVFTVWEIWEFIFLAFKGSSRSYSNVFTRTPFDVKCHYVKIYKWFPHIYAIALTVSEMLKLKIIFSISRSRSQGTILIPKNSRLFYLKLNFSNHKRQSKMLRSNTRSIVHFHAVYYCQQRLTSRAHVHCRFTVGNK